MNFLYSLTRPVIQLLVYSSTSLLFGLAFFLHTHLALAQSGGIYAIPGLYTYTVPAGGPYQIRVTTRGGDGGGYNRGVGGTGATVASTFTVQSGNVLTIIVGERGFGTFSLGPNTTTDGGGGGGGGGSAVVARNGTPTLLVAAGGGGGGGVMFNQDDQAIPCLGGGGQGSGSDTPGVGGPSNNPFSSGGGGGGLQGPGGQGGAGNGLYPGGGGGGAASLTAVSAGGISPVTYNHDTTAGGSGFGGGGAAGGFDTPYGDPAGGGGGGYGGGNGAKAGPVQQSDANNPIYYATGGYSNASVSGTNTTITPGIAGASQSRDGMVTISFPNNTATAAFTSANQTICSGSPTTLQGTVSATGSWTLVLSDGSMTTGSGSSFSIPISPVTSTTYAIASLTDQTFVNANNLTSKTIVTVNPLPTVSLTNSGPLTCAQTSVTLTATSNATSYTFSSGGTILAGVNTSNTRVVSSPGDYVVRVSGVGSCTNSATTTVTRTQETLPTVSLGNNGPLTCAQISVTLTATGSSSYTFTSGNTILPGDPISNTRVVSSPGDYVVRVSDANSCTNSATTTVTQSQANPLTVSLTNSGPLTCAQTSVTLTATSNATSYTFSNGGTILAGDNTSNTRIVSTPGDYLVRVSGVGSCTSSATTTVTQSQVFPVSLSNNGPFTCAQASVTLTASGGTSYTFTSQGNVLPGDPASNTRVVTSTGDYVVRVANDNGCTNTAYTTVTEGQGLLPSWSLHSNGPFNCRKPTVTLFAESLSTSNPPVSYTFTYGNTVLPGDPTSDQRDISEPGLYRVRVTGRSGCTDEKEIYVERASEVQPVLYALLDDGPLSCAKPYVKMTVLADGNSQLYKFIGEGISQDRFSNVDFEFVNKPGTYTVVALNSANGCTKVATTTVSRVTNSIINPTNTSFLVDQGVNEIFEASNGVSPYSNFTVVSGSLPPGLSLSTYSVTGSVTSRGRLAGAPTQAGSFTVVIQASDANGCLGQGLPYVMNVAPFAITSQPANKSVCPASPVTVSVGIVGRPTAYQWYKNDPSGVPAIVPGQTAATLSLASVSPSDGGSYVVVITGGGLSLTSTAATMTILSSSPARFYVNANATGANTGLDWDNAFTDLQSALKSSYQCLTALREIWVAGGLYKPTTTNDRNSVFEMLPDVVIYGGFVGNETALSQRSPMNPITGHPSSSTLSGNIGQPGDASDNSQSIIKSYNLGSTAVLDGFVITGSKSDPTNILVGGSLINTASYTDSSPTLINLLFINNTNGNLGGAILNYAEGGKGNPLIINCLFQKNTAVNAGGAIANYGYNGITNPVITNCLFQNNTANWGGAIITYAYGATTSGPVITNCSFQSNNATTQGGAMWNVTQQNGVISPTLTNCSFQGNIAPAGGAVYNSTVFGGPTSGTVRLSMANDVLFDNGGANSISNAGDATLSASYSLFDATVTGYTNVAGNLTATTSPFANATGTQLKSDSPAINAGNNQAYQVVSGPSTDLIGNTRIQQTTIDMGAYESQSNCNTVLTVSAGASLPMVNLGTVVNLTASVAGAVGAITYQWSAPGSASLTSPANSSAVFAKLTTAGVQTFTVVASSGGCSQSAMVSVTALAGPDLTAIMSLPDANFSAGESKGLLMQLQEVNGSLASGNIVVTITVPVGYSVSFDNTLTSFTVSGAITNPVVVDNPKWHQSSNAGNRLVSITINGGQSVEANSTMGLGFTITRTTANSGSMSNITVNVADDSGGQYDVNRLNNVYARLIQGL